MQPIRNFCIVETAAAYNSLVTEISLIANDGLKLPDPAIEGSFNLVWFNFTDYKNPSDDPLREIIKVTAKHLDTLTIVRGQENTIATAKSITGKTYKLILTLTKENYDSIIPGRHGAISPLNDGNLVPDNLGDNAVDLQFIRANANQAAQGTCSFIAGGNNNTVTGQSSFAANTANTVTGESSSAFGYNNICSGEDTFASGRDNKAQGKDSFAYGHGAVARLKCQTAKANEYFITKGDCQSSNIILRRITEGEISAILSLDNTDNLSGKVILEDNTSYLFKGIVLGRSSNVLSAAYKIEGLIQRGSGAISTAISGNASVTRIQDDSLTCDVTAEADNINGALSIIVTGQSGHTIKWVCSLDILELK